MTEPLSQTDLQQVYADLMKTAFAPALRDAGLKGLNGRFEFPSPIYWVQLGFQKDVHNYATRLRFTVNLSVINRARWTEETARKTYWGKRPSPNIGYSNWARSTRIGSILPSGEDKWWELSPGIESASVRDDVLTGLTDYAIPWLQKHSAAPTARVVARKTTVVRSTYPDRRGGRYIDDLAIGNHRVHGLDCSAIHIGDT